MPKRRDCAKSVIESSSDLNRVKSWAFALWSLAGLEVHMLARELSTYGRTVEKAAVRWIIPMNSKFFVYLSDIAKLAKCNFLKTVFEKPLK